LDEKLIFRPKFRFSTKINYILTLEHPNIDQQDELEKISRIQSERISELEDENIVESANHQRKKESCQKDLVKDMDDKYRDLQTKYDNLGKGLS